MSTNAEPSRRPRVAIVYRTVYRYRLPFYEALRQMLDQRGIDLHLIYGQPTAEEERKGDTVDVPWGTFVPSRIMRLAGREVYWQPVLAELDGADLVIVEQASRLLVNYVLLVRQALGATKVALWGHGRSVNASDASAVGEWLKRQMSTRVHWWFAYNRLAADVVASMGYPPERITNVRNAIDSRELVAVAETTSAAELRALRARLGIDSERVGVYVGGMYEEKRIPFLLEACHEIRRRVPEFEMVFMGAGVDEDAVASAAAAHDWIHWLGPRFGADMARHALLGRVLLMPGRVGLAVLDAFALGLPMVTTDVPFHSPEIAYLEHGRNGLMLGREADASAYADAVADLLLDDAKRERLIEGCLRAREEYSIEEMARRFADGVERALAI